MIIDNNDFAKRQQELDSQGLKQEAREMRMEFLRQVKESGIDHCSCKEPCPHHGNCYECVLIHRGHQDHLPYCFWEMVNEKLYGISKMTEGSLCSYSPCERGEKNK